MLNSNQLPGTGSIADSVEFVKKLWGIPSAGALPGMLIPTLSLEDINKKITDLKAVESWLALNMNMLRGTIQALEVQSATIVNLQSMGAILSQQRDEKSEGSAAATAFPFPFPAWPAASAPASTPEPAARQPEPTPPPVSPASAEKNTAGASGTSGTSGATGATAGAAGAAAGIPDPNAWWDLLQNQFKQAVGTALMPDMAKAAADAANPGKGPAVAKSAPKPAVKKAPAKSRAKSPVAGAKKI